MVFLGTSGYQFDDWIGTAYPEGVPRSKMLGYYSTVWQFNAVELNFTYYRMPTSKTLAGIMNKAAGNPIVFSVKAFGDVTHKHWRAYDYDSLRDDSSRFLEAVSPLSEASRLGAILFQFPSSFRPGQDNRRYLVTLASMHQESGTRLAVEFRHRDWNNEDTYGLLESLDMIPVVVDEPKIRSLFPYVNRASPAGAYFRFHGRNTDWFTADASERYNYDYSESELREFAADVLEFSRRDLDVFVFFNNCYMGRAVHNALRFRELLEGAY